jgi:Na+-driven multidrug efflux pump
MTDYIMWFLMSIFAGIGGGIGSYISQRHFVTKIQKLEKLLVDDKKEELKK